MHRRKPLFILGLLLLCQPALAADEPSLAVEVGWGGKVRPGRWNPIFLTLQGTDRPTQTWAEVFSPRGRSSGDWMRERFVVEHEPLTYPLYANPGEDLSTAAAVLRDVETGRKLADRWLVPFRAGAQFLTRGSSLVDASQCLVGVCNRRPMLQLIDNTPLPKFPGGPYRTVRIGNLPLERLPQSPVGYDALDLLILGEMELSSIDSKTQQTTIADWVRAGGRLIIWFGTASIPDDAPILDILPCQVGQASSLKLSTTQPLLRTSATRPTLTWRPLMPAAAATSLPLLGEPSALAVHDRVGLGQVVVLSIDPSTLDFPDGRAAMEFWRPLLADAGGLALAKKPAGDSEYDYFVSLHGLQSVMRCVPDGPTSNPWLPLLLGFAAVVGPVDAIVLTMLGRRPWTKVVAVGWLATLLLGLTWFLTSRVTGSVEVNTLRLADEVDGRQAGATDVAYLHAWRPATLAVDAPMQSWWSSIDPTMGALESPTLTHVQQHSRGTKMEPLDMHLGDRMWLRGETLPGAAATPAAVDAALVLHADPKPRITGTITNHGSTSLRNLQIRGRSGIITIKSLAAGNTMTVDAAFTAVALEAAYGAAAALTPARSQRIDDLLSSNDHLVCIYAELANAPASVTFSGSDIHPRHQQVIRALVPLK